MKNQLPICTAVCVCACVLIQDDHLWLTLKLSLMPTSLFTPQPEGPLKRLEQEKIPVLDSLLSHRARLAGENRSLKRHNLAETCKKGETDFHHRFQF